MNSDAKRNFQKKTICRKTLLFLGDRIFNKPPFWAKIIQKWLLVTFAAWRTSFNKKRLLTRENNKNVFQDFSENFMVLLIISFESWTVMHLVISDLYRFTGGIFCSIAQIIYQPKMWNSPESNKCLRLQANFWAAVFSVFWFSVVTWREGQPFSGLSEFTKLFLRILNAFFLIHTFALANFLNISMFKNSHAFSKKFLIEKNLFWEPLSLCTSSIKNLSPLKKLQKILFFFLRNATFSPRKPQSSYLSGIFTTSPAIYGKGNFVAIRDKFQKLKLNLSFGH